MATSGSVDYNRTRAQIVTRALRQCHAIELGETPDADLDNIATEALNALVKAWQADGIRLWTRREATLFVTPSQASYGLGLSSSDHAAEDTEIARTTLGGDEAAGQTALTVASITGIADADQLGIVLDDDTFHWTTVSGAPSGTTVTAAVALPSAASSGNKVYAYTNALNRPLRIIDVRRRDETSDQDTPIIPMAHEEYYRLPNKTNEGEANQIYYHPTLGDGTIYVWPVPETVDRTIKMTCLLPIEDFDAAANDPDFPQEWLNALSWNLADELITEIPVPDKLAARINGKAAYWYDKVQQWDQEPESLFFQPNLTHAYGG